MKEINSFSEADTKKAAKEIAKNLSAAKNGPKVVCLKGQLGAGKTVFVKGFSEMLGIDPCLVKSPTYTFLRKYMAKGVCIYHFDYYRLNETNDLVENEIMEIIDGENNIVLIEWPEKIEHILPEDRIEILIEHEGKGKNNRKIKINNFK